MSNTTPTTQSRTAMFLIAVLSLVLLLWGVAMQASAQSQQPVPVVSTPPPADTLIIDKLGDVGATIGGNGLLVALIWYFFAKREPEREERNRQMVRELADAHGKALAEQREEFSAALAEQREMMKGLIKEHLEARAASRQVIDNNTRAIGENTAALRDSTQQMKQH